MWKRYAILAKYVDSSPFGDTTPVNWPVPKLSPLPSESLNDIEAPSSPRGIILNTEETKLHTIEQQKAMQELKGEIELNQDLQDNQIDQLNKVTTAKGKHRF